MSDLKFCPDCGARLVAGDRFCGDCGFDTMSLAEPAVSPSEIESGGAAGSPEVTVQPETRSSEAAGHQTPAPQSPATQPVRPGEPPTGSVSGPPGTTSGSNKKALIIMVSLLALVFIAGGGIYWWLSHNEPGGGISPPDPLLTEKEIDFPWGDSQEEPVVSDKSAAPMDLSRASTYLAEPGLKMTFYVNYPDGMAGIVDRISGRAVPNEAVRVSEVELGIERGEEYGYGFHYVERPDGTYYILDNTPYEIYPVLKNNLTVGQTWSYDTQDGSIIYEVIDMGVHLDLGFARFENCLLLKEDNQIVGWQSITYYAPGRGSVLVIAPGGGLEYYKPTALESIDEGTAAQTIIKWCPNYNDIKDDRTQSY